MNVPLLRQIHSALYLRDDPYESTDAVFGVKDTLLVDFNEVDEDQARQYSVQMGTSLLSYDFVLVTEDAAMELRQKEAWKAMAVQGQSVKFVDGLPVPDVD